MTILYLQGAFSEDAARADGEYGSAFPASVTPYASYVSYASYARETAYYTKPSGRNH